MGTLFNNLINEGGERKKIEALIDKFQKKRDKSRDTFEIIRYANKINKLKRKLKEL